MLVERGDAVIVEPGGDGAEHRQLFRVDVEALPVASHLAAHVAQRVLGSSPFELVDDDDLGEVEHVDLLELARGPELGRHHVDRHVDVVDDPGIALPDAGRLHDHEVVPRRSASREDVIEGLGQLARPAGGQRAEQHLRRVDGVHADPVTEQRTAAAPPRRIDGDHGDPELVLLVEAEPPQQLVGERRLARPTGARDAQHRDRPAARRRAELVQQRRVEPAQLEGGDGAGERALVTGEELVHRGQRHGDRVHVARLDDRVDHRGQAHALSVLRREDPGDAVLLQLRDLARDDHAAAPAEDAHVTQAASAQLVDQVAEVLVVPALVRRHRHALGVLLHDRGDHLLHRPVVAEVDHLAALRLQDPPHDVDGGVVPVEEARGRHDPHRMRGHVQRRTPCHAPRVPSCWAPLFGARRLLGAPLRGAGLRPSGCHRWATSPGGCAALPAR